MVRKLKHKEQQIVDIFDDNKMNTIQLVIILHTFYRSFPEILHGQGMRGRGGEGRKETLADKPLDFENLPFPPPPLSFCFGCRPIFRAGKTPKIPFFGLSLLPNPTETLATLAS